MSSRFIIYGLVDPLSDELRYVGKSSNGMLRPRAHVSQALRGDDDYCHRWIRQLLALDLMYQVVVLEELDCAEWLGVHEQWWIAFARAWGCRLTNLTLGGEGSPGWNPTATTRARMSAASRATMARDDVRAKLSASQREAWSKPSTRARQVAAQRAANDRRIAALRETLASPAAKAKMKAAAVRRWSNPEYRAKQLRASNAEMMSEAVRAAQARPEVKARRRATEDLPETKARRSAAACAVWKRRRTERTTT